MIVLEAVELLKESELKQLTISDEKNTIRGYINQGITEIYKKFDLWEETAVITMAAGIKNYTISSEDVNVALDNEDHEFIMILKIEDQDGEEIDIGLEKTDYKIKISRYNRIRIDNPVAGDTIEVLYKACPKFLTGEKQEIPLPPQYMESLFHYVGYRAHSSVDGDIKGENNTHYMRFLQSCDRIKFYGLENEDSMEVSKLSKRGFV